MKKLFLLTLTLLVSLSSYSKNNDLEACKSILGAALFNQILEEVCGFEGNVKENLKKIYDENRCREIVPQSTVDYIIRDNLEDSRMRFKAFGEKKFCEENMKPYVELMDSLKRN